MGGIVVVAWFCLLLPFVVLIPSTITPYSYELLFIVITLALQSLKAGAAITPYLISYCCYFY
jgi:hypothetical protein